MSFPDKQNTLYTDRIKKNKSDEIPKTASRQVRVLCCFSCKWVTAFTAMQHQQ